MEAKSRVTWTTPHLLVGLLSGTRRLRRCLVLPPGANVERARRRVYELAFAELTPGITVTARCHRRCANPFHLQVRRERGEDGRVAYCKRGHLLLEGNVYRPRPEARRICRERARITQRTRARRKLKPTALEKRAAAG
jgi:hypothetical protein